MRSNQRPDDRSESSQERFRSVLDRFGTQVFFPNRKVLCVAPLSDSRRRSRAVMQIPMLAPSYDMMLN